MAISRLRCGLAAATATAAARSRASTVQTLGELGMGFADAGQGQGGPVRIGAAFDFVEGATGQQAGGHAVDATAGFADQQMSGHCTDATTAPRCGPRRCRVPCCWNGGGANTLQRMSRLRVALCQLNVVVGDLGANAQRDHRGPRRGEAMPAPIWPCSPSWSSPATRPRTCCSSPASSPTTWRLSAKVAAASERCAAVVGFVDERHRSVQRGRRLRLRAGPGRVPQADAAQLRGLRRAALLRGRAPVPPSCF